MGWGSSLLKKGSWALADQGLFAFSNFLISVLLARWLLPAEFGAFSVSLTAFQLVGLVHTAVLVEPMLVFGAGEKDKLSRYLTALIRAHAALSAAMAGALLLGAVLAVLVGAHSLAVLLAAIVVGAPAVLLLWLVRRACYVELRPDLAVIGGGAYMALAVGGAYVTNVRGHLSPAATWVLMGSSALLVSALLASRLGVTLSGLIRQASLPGMVSRHLAYARWATPSNVLGFAAGGLYYFLLPISHGLEAAGALRGLTNLVAPLGHVAAATGSFLLPVFAKKPDATERRRLAYRAAAMLAAGGALYSLIVAIWGTPLVAALYASEYYTGQADALTVLGPAMVVYGVGAVAGAGLRALERPDRVFRASAYSAIIAASVGTLLTLFFGVPGAAVATLVAWCAGAVVQWIDVSRLSWQNAPRDGPTLARPR